uniref:DNA-binding protein n=1 Tax=Geobacter metallireducens TaxID=28232 RepID=A0A831TYN5_GEOME
MIGRREFFKAMGAAALVPFAPFRRERGTRRIDLLEVHIAGFQYHEGMRPGVFSMLGKGGELWLRREPDNPYDPSAIAVLTPRGNRLGYLPRRTNGIPAAILDQGVTTRAGIVEVNAAAPTWERVRVKVWMEV